jgi:hypothetical protein
MLRAGAATRFLHDAAHLTKLAILLSPAAPTTTMTEDLADQSFGRWRRGADDSRAQQPEEKNRAPARNASEGSAAEH